MDGASRRQELLNILSQSQKPVPGAELARKLQVSRQVIVQDIALLRAQKEEILSTNRGYMLQEKKREAVRIFKVQHTDQQIEEEMNCIVDQGGEILDVFVYHKVYGVIKAPMGIRSRREVAEYLENLKNGISSPLMRITNDYHYHTVAADSEKTLDLIQKALKEKGFLAALRNFEPVDFWN
ncbi:MAG: transcription repressor NadR [Candidatus Limivivens sp.]|nr:transcription repressor NadR [Candidatus Limivivens sp.]